MALLEVEHLNKSFGATSVLKDISFSLDEGHSVAIIGSSGSGKTTLLRCLNFLETPGAGRITVAGETLYDGTAVTDEHALRQKRLHFGLVFQSFNLFPQYTALENVTLAVKLREPSKSNWAAIDAHGLELLERMGLADRAKHYPHQLSGGQQQRAALARLFASDPECLLLDEPFSALDGYLRWEMELELTDFLREFPGPAVLVTHDRGEVYRMCRQACVLDHGRSEPEREVKALFQAPDTLSACLLSGCKNVSRARRAGEGRVEALDWGVTLDVAGPVPPELAHVGIRAHFITPGPGPNPIPCRVERVVEDVFSTVVMLTAPGPERLRMELSKEGWEALGEPDRLTVSVKPEDIMLLK